MEEKFVCQMRSSSVWYGLSTPATCLKRSSLQNLRKIPQTPVQGSAAHEPLLSREATSHSLTAMLVWSCRLQYGHKKYRMLDEQDNATDQFVQNLQRLH